MKKTFIFFLQLSSLLIEQGFADISINDTQIVMSIIGSQSEFEAGKPVIMEISVKNSSTNGIRFFQANHHEDSSDFNFLITTPSGKVVSSDTKRLYTGSGVYIFVPPTQVQKIQFKLDTFPRLQQLGNYTVVLKLKLHLVGKESKKIFEAVSNPLSFTIIPPKYEMKEPRNDVKVNYKVVTH
jgi:hypothetical protein